MSRGQFSPAKRQREEQRARKQQQKAARRQQRRERGTQEVPVVSAQEIIGELPTSSEAMRAIDERARAPRAAPALPARLFVGGLQPTVTAEDLRTAFATIGPVIDVYVATDRDTGKPRGFAFVTMGNSHEAAKAIAEMNGAMLDGRALRVNEAEDRQQFGGGGGGGGRGGGGGGGGQRKRW